MDAVDVVCICVWKPGPWNPVVLLLWYGAAQEFDLTGFTVLWTRLYSLLE